MLLFYTKHPVLAVRDIFGIDLAPHQRIDLRLTWEGKSSNIIKLYSRGMSKTFLDALEGLLYSILNEALSIIFLGGDGFRQGKNILMEAQKIINNEIRGQRTRYFLRNCIDRRPSQAPVKKEPDVWTIPFKNFSMIRTAPIGDGNQIRGYRAHVIFKDERKDMPSDIDEKVVRPFSILARDVTSQEQKFNNMNIDSGTLEYEEDDYTKLAEKYQDLMEKGSKEYLFLKFEYIDAFKEDPNGKFYSNYYDKNYSYWKTPYAIRMKAIEDGLYDGTMDEESWNAEYRCLPKRATGNVFTYHDVKGITDFELMTEKAEQELIRKYDLAEKIISLRFLRPQLECDDPVIIGVDVARESANTAFVVLRLGQLATREWDPVNQVGKTPFSNIIFAHQEKNMPYAQTAHYIYDLLERYPNTLLVAMDKGGGGGGVRDSLLEYAVKKQMPVLFDLEDDKEGGVALKVDQSVSDPRLALMTYSAEDNTMALNRVKGAVQKKKMLLVRGNRGETVDESLAYNFIHEIGSEMRIIKTKPVGNWLKIIIDNPGTNTQETAGRRTKDLWSALMYAYNEAFIRFLFEGKKKKKIVNYVGLISLNREQAIIN
jgi:hypothetical protein